MKTVKVTTKNVVSIIDVDFDNYKDIQRAIEKRRIHNRCGLR